MRAYTNFVDGRSSCLFLRFSKTIKFNKRNTHLQLCVVTDTTNRWRSWSKVRVKVLFYLWLLSDLAFRSALKPHFLHLASWKARNKLDLSAENIRPQTTNRASKPKPKTPAKSHVHGKQAKAGHGYLAQSNPPFPSPPAHCTPTQTCSDASKPFWKN